LVVSEKNVLGLEVGVDKVQVMQKGNASKELSSKVLDLAVRKRHETVALQEVENALAKEVHNNANMAAVVEAVPEMYASVSIFVVVGLQGRQYTQLYSRGIAILLDRANDFDGDKSVSFPIASLDHLAKSALTKEAADLIIFGQMCIRHDNEVSIVIIDFDVLVVMVIANDPHRNFRNLFRRKRWRFVCEELATEPVDVSSFCVVGGLLTGGSFPLEW
jgi:hypothetical protein